MYDSYSTASPLTRPISPKPPLLRPVTSIPHWKTMRATKAIAEATMIGFVASRI